MISRSATVLASVFLLGAAPSVLDKPARYATDKAGVIPEERLAALNEELARFERETSNQIVVYVDRRLPADTTLEELATATFRSWAIGQKDRSNGVLFLVFVDDRAMRVEVGYGLEGVLTDAKARRITSEVVKPLFRKGDYAGGIEAGARALMATARTEGYAGTGRTVAETGPGLAPWALGTTFVAGFVPFVIGLARRERTGQRIPGILAMACAAGAIASFASAVVTSQGFFWGLGVFLFVATLVLGIVNAIVSGPGRPRGAAGAASTADDADRRPSWSSSSSASSDSSASSSDSSSSSDFSGGGGDSGGGGSSDKW